MASSSLQQEKANHGDDTKNIVLKKGKWLPEEDALLRNYVVKYGAKRWDKVREKLKLDRDGKSCRFRWLNSLKPSLKKCPFSEEEREKLIRLYNKLGPKWSQMISEFPRRTDNELKNFINSRKRSLKNSRKHLIPENINDVDELKDNVGAVSYQQNNASQEEIALPRIEFDHQNIMHGNYLDQIYDEEIINNFDQFSTLVDDSNMLSNNVGITSLSNHIIPTLNDRFPTFPEYSYFQDEKNINNFEPLSKLVDNSNILHNNVENTSLSVVPDLFKLPKYSYIQDREDTLPSFTSSNMFFDQNLPPLPQCSYNQDMGYQHPSFSSGVFFDQYPQNPILLSHEIQYEMLKPNSPRSNGYLEAMLYPPKI